MTRDRSFRFSLRSHWLTEQAIVLVTVFALGTTTAAALKLLQIDVNVDEEEYMEDWLQKQRTANILSCGSKNWCVVT